MKIKLNGRYRRVLKDEKSKKQGYQVALSFAFFIFLFSIVAFFAYVATSGIEPLHSWLVLIVVFLTLMLLFFSILSLFLFFRRDRVAPYEVEKMSFRARMLARKIRKLFSDKQVIDVLNISNKTRYGNEIPEIYVWVNDKLDGGYIAIENISNFDRLDRDKFEQKLSGTLTGRLKKFAVVSSSLVLSDSYMRFYFEDAEISKRLIVSDLNDGISKFISKDVHSIRLAEDLVWHSDVVPHLSVIARTRAGKSVLCGRYIAKLAKLQGWKVEYNSVKFDRYVKEFNGCSDALAIVERAEFWCSVMRSRLEEINLCDKEKSTEVSDMCDIAVFFDEIGNLNAELELDKPLKKRWDTAINKLSATGASAGIHVIAISQYATKEGFLPSLARVNCSDAVIMLGGAADSADERRYLMPGFADLPKRNYSVGEGVACMLGSGEKWGTPHFYETPWFV